MVSNNRHAHDQHVCPQRNVLSVVSSSGTSLADGKYRAARSSIHARPLSGVLLPALPVVSVIVALGVCMPSDARAQATTVNPVQSTTFSPSPTQNPITFGSTTNIATNGGDAISGASGTVWDVIIQSQAIVHGNRNGVFLDSASSSLTNSGDISGTNNSGVSLTQGGIVVNQVGGKINGGNSGIDIIFDAGTVTNAGTITGGTNSVLFEGAGTNTLTLKTGSVLIGDAVGSTATGATNQLVLQGTGTADNVFQNFNSLAVQAAGTWVWNNTSTIGSTTIASGTLAVDGALTSPITMNSGTTLAGRGSVTGPVTVNLSAAVAPGAVTPFSTLTVDGNVGFTTGSFYKVNVNAAGQHDTLQVVNGGKANLTGAIVNVLAQNGTYLPSTQYTILTAAGGGLGPANNNAFSSVTTNLAFLTPSLSYDANNVFLTLDCNATSCSSGSTGGGGSGGGATVSTGFGFATAAQTRNQQAVAGALDASPQSNPLVTALLGQTADGARQAFDALSGEVFGSVQKVQAGQMQFARSAMLGRMRQASHAGAPGELGALAFNGAGLAYASGEAAAGQAQANNAYAAFPAKAAPGAMTTSRDLTFWALGLGGWGHADSDGNAASLTSRFGGFLSGADARFGDSLRAGLVAGYTRTDLNVDARASSAGIDSAQFGAYAGGRVGAFNVRGGASYSYDSIDTSRSIAFTGFSDQTHAHFHGNVGQVFGEVGYGMAFNQVAIEPLAGLAYVHVRDGSFQESGGAAALSGASTRESIGYSSLGVRAATAVPLANGTVLVPRGSVHWQYAFGDVNPATALAFQGTGTGFTVAGLPIARNTALVESGVDWRFSPQAKLGASYQGELAAHAQTHAFKGAFTWNF
jgi:outer membrane autotransporter protein